jgi:hypothetical protein
MPLRLRLLCETTLTVVFAFLLLLTLLAPNWIEQVFAVDPDQGLGEVEWMLVAVVGICGIGSARLVRRDWLRFRSISRSQ